MVYYFPAINIYSKQKQNVVLFIEKDGDNNDDNQNQSSQNTSYYTNIVTTGFLNRLCTWKKSKKWRLYKKRKDSRAGIHDTYVSLVIHHK